MMGILAGMALGGMTTTTVRAAAIVAAGVFIFHVPFEPTSWWLLALVFVLTLAALYGLGMMFASLFLLWGREAWHMVNLLQEPVYLLTGMNFPLKTVFPLARRRGRPAHSAHGRDGRDAAGAVPGRGSPRRLAARSACSPAWRWSSWRRAKWCLDCAGAQGPARRGDSR